MAISIKKKKNQRKTLRLTLKATLSGQIEGIEHMFSEWKDFFSYKKWHGKQRKRFLAYS